MPYIIADSEAAAERVMTLVPRAAFADLDAARDVLVGYPNPNRYRIFAVVRADGAWMARELENADV